MKKIASGKSPKSKNGRRFDKKKCLRIALPVLLLVVLIFSYTPPGTRMWSALSEAAGLVHFTNALPEDALLVHVIDVGKADAILLESPETTVLVDCGTEAEAKTVLRYLAARNIEALDAVWISHPDSDHCGGLAALLEAFPVAEIVESPVAASVAETVPLSQNQRIERAKVGENYRYGDMAFEVIGPLADYSETNNGSVVFRLVCGEFSMLFCGDIEEKAEQDLLESGASLRADVLKVAHHGSATSTSEAFLQAVQPEYAVISTGEDRNNLPRNLVLKRLDAEGVTFFRTDTDGPVVITAEDGHIRIITENGRTAP